MTNNIVKFLDELIKHGSQLEFIRDKEELMGLIYFRLKHILVRLESNSHKFEQRDLIQLLVDYDKVWHLTTSYVNLNVVETKLPKIVYSHCVRAKNKFDLHAANVIIVFYCFSITSIEKEVRPIESFSQFCFKFHPMVASKFVYRF